MAFADVNWLRLSDSRVLWHMLVSSVMKICDSHSFSVLNIMEVVGAKMHTNGTGGSFGQDILNS